MQQDIEIYVLSVPTHKILSWLANHFTILSKPVDGIVPIQLVIEYQNKPIEISICEGAGGKKFTSIWFDSADTPWKNDIECARSIYNELRCEVRCNASGWQEDSDSDPDQWWRINDYEEGPFIWR
jgi:hypothetical protein